MEAIAKATNVKISSQKAKLVMDLIRGRAYSEGKLVPPAPLPHVSRHALRRVKDWMPPPTC